ncbi:MAG: bifunctional ADP-heptose synthase [Candidatus Liptonbacteria bacterium]|nr:bifunctional ADP-heptose synthase [Candidatus Liptonbacteria bacterium]
MQKQRHHEFIKKFPQMRVLVAGDIMLDHYISGVVERISPEAPVPVVLEKSREYFLGGAGNVAANIAALGGKVTLLGAVGNDVEGRLVYKLCKKMGITTSLVKEKGRPTSRKARILAGPHQLLRLDMERVDDISKDVEHKIARDIKSLGEHNLVVISDYSKGYLTKGVVDALKKKFGGRRIIANIKPTARAGFFGNVRLLTFNSKEAYDIAHIPVNTDRGAVRAALALSKKFKSSVVITRGEHGMTVYDRVLGKTSHISSDALKVFDVIGAGDTVIAALALMQACGASLAESAHVANKAAAVVVGIRGTATVSPEELLAKL